MNWGSELNSDRTSMHKMSKNRLTRVFLLLLAIRLIPIVLALALWGGIIAVVVWAVRKGQERSDRTFR